MNRTTAKTTSRAPLTKALAAAFTLLAALAIAFAPGAAWAEDGSSEQSDDSVASAVVDGETLYYADLQDAISAADTVSTVTLLMDVTISDSYLLISKSLTLDLGGYELTFATTKSIYNAAIYISDGDVTIKNGTITDKRCYGYTASGVDTIWMYGDSLTTSDVTIQAYAPNSTSDYNYIIYIQPYNGNYPSVTLGEGTTIKDLGNSHASSGYQTLGCVGVTILGAYDTSSLSSSSDNYGITAETTVSLTVKDGVTIYTESFAISGNGAYHGTSITIEGGTITSYGGTVIIDGVEYDTGGTAIYHPQYGTLTITGGTITGADTGVEIRAGVLTMSGGSVTGEGASTETQANGNGTTSTGAAIAVSQHTTNLALSVTITGGTLKGYTALYEEDTTGDGDTSGISLSVTGGTFISTDTSDDAQAIYSADCTGFITGGAYSVDPDGTKYLSSGCSTVTVSISGETYYVISSVTNAVAAIVDEDGNITELYSTVSAAISAADSTDTVTLLADVTESVTVASGASITLDLNGYTLTGSTTHAISNYGTLVITDSSTDGSGAIVSNDVAQAAALANYPGATCTINGGNLSGNKWYVIKNLGTLTINGGSVTQNESTTSAIDNGWYGSTSNDMGLSASSYTDPTATLTITGGTFSGGVNVVKNDDYGNCTITGGTFSNTTGAVIANWNVMTISGGTFTGADGYCVIANGYCSSASDVGQLTITGGTFTAYDSTGSIFGLLSGSQTNSTSYIKISGGSFTGDLDSAVSMTAAGYYTVSVSGGSFSVEVDEEICAEGYESSDKDATNGRYTVIKYTEPADVTVTYDGQSHSASVTGTDSDTTVTYTYDGTTQSTAFSFTDAGTYEVSYTVTDSDGATVTGTYTVTINQVQTTISLSDITVSYGTSYTQTATLSISDTSASESLSLPEGAAATITYYTDVNCTNEWEPEDDETTPTEAGTYYAKAVYAGSTNFAGSNAIATLTIQAVDLSFSAVSYSGTYDGEAHGITVTAEGATITYASSSDGEYSSTNPTYKNAGTYTVYYKIVKDNYNTVTGSTTVVIAKATPTVTMSDVSITYDGSYTVSATVTGVGTELASAAVTYVYYTDSDCTTKWTDSGSETQPTEAGTYYVKATYAGSDNYNEASAVATITIAQAGQSLSYENDSVSVHLGGTVSNTLTQTAVYGTITYSSSDTSVATVDSTGAVTILAEGEATITATAAPTSNYSEASASYTLTVSDHTYGGTPTWEWTGTYDDDGTVTGYTATATFTCTVEGCSDTTSKTVTATSSTTDATCTEDGSTTYTATLAYDSTIYTDTKTDNIVATGHTYDYDTLTWTWADDYSSATVSYSCTTCDDTVTVDATVKSSTTDATCTEDGCTTYTATATVNGAEETDSKTVTISATGHTADDAVIENEVEATCTTDGSYDTVVYCTVCGAELSRETTTVAATGHTAGDAVVENEVEATCTTDGSYDSVVYCTVCGAEISRETVTVEATGHSYVSVVTDPTCTAAGYTTYTCSVCGSSYVSDYTSPTGHTYVYTGSTSSTCTDEGVLTYTCSVCGETYTQAISATGHTAGEAVVENEVAATCTTDGSYDTVVYCTVCGAQISRETTTIEATGHTAGEAVVENEVAATCTTDGSYDTVVYCTVCGEEISRETTTVEAKGHTYDYESLTWTWADDYSSATVSFSCTSGDDTVTVEATVTSETTDATCTEDGCTTYTATATVNGAEVTDTVTVAGTAATGHTWEPADEATWSADYATATLAFTCSSCSTTQTVTASLADATITYAVTTEATATTAGVGVYTAVFELDGATYTVEAEVEIPATGEESDDDASEGDSDTDDGTTEEESGDDDATEDGTTEGDEDTDTGTDDSDSGEEDATDGDEESDDSDATDDGASDEGTTDDTDATDEDTSDEEATDDDTSDDGTSGEETSDDSGTTGETGTTGGGSAGGSAHGTAGGSAGSGESSSADGAELAKTGDATTAFAAGFGLTAALAAIVAAVAALRRRRAA